MQRDPPRPRAARSLSRIRAPPWHGSRWPSSGARPAPGCFSGSSLRAKDRVGVGCPAAAVTWARVLQNPVLPFHRTWFWFLMVVEVGNRTSSPGRLLCRTSRFPVENKDASAEDSVAHINSGSVC